jgi:hypothetical protein
LESKHPKKGVCNDKKRAGALGADGQHLRFHSMFYGGMMFAVIGIPIRKTLGLNATEFGLLTAMPVLTGSLIRVPLGIYLYCPGDHWRADQGRNSTDRHVRFCHLLRVVPGAELVVLFAQRV